MSFLRKFFKETFGDTSNAEHSPNDGASNRAGEAPVSGSLIDPFAENEESDESGGEESPNSGGLVDPFADGESAADDDSEARAEQHFNEAETLFQGGQYDEAADQYKSSYKDANVDQRGSLAYNTAQAFRRAKNYSYAVVWYQKALDLGGPEVTEVRATIEEHLATMQDEMKKEAEQSPGGAKLGEAQMLYQQAEIAMLERDYANAEALYKQANSRSNAPALLFNIGQACRLGGKHADAKYWFREYLRQVPDSPDKAIIEGLIEEMKRKVPDPPEMNGDAAVEDAEEKFNQAELLYKAGQFSEAADLYVEVFHDPAVASVRGEMAFNLGQCMRKLGNANSAVAWYQKALEFFPADSALGKQIADQIAELTGTNAESL